MENYNRYKKLKEELDFIYKGIHINGPMSSRIWSIANGGKLEYKYIVRAFLTLSFPKMDKQKKIFAVYSRFKRKDYEELFKTVTDKLGDEVYPFYLNDCKYIMHVNLKSCLAVFRFFFSKERQDKLSLKEKMYLIFNYIGYCNFVDILFNMDFGEVRKFLCMQSAQPYENILTQFFHNIGMKTYSLSEGVYYVQRSSITWDCLSYENSVTDFFLLWGNFTYQEFKNWGMPENKMLIAGYAKNFRQIKMKQENKFRTCLALLAREQFRKSNLDMLTILGDNRYNFKVCLKLHPGSDFAFYEKYANEHDMTIVPNEKTIYDCLDNSIFDFAVGVNTGAYYDTLLRGVPCLRYSDDTFQVLAGYDDIFDNCESFEDKYNKIRNISKNEYQKEIDEVLKNDMGVGIDKYREILLAE